MGRAIWEKLPLDKGKVPAYIDKILQSCASQAVRDILTKHKKQRDLDIRDASGFEMKSVTGKLAAAVQQHGEVEQDPCDFCRKGEAAVAFGDCVRIAGEQYGKCASCIFNRQTCSKGIPTQNPIGKNQYPLRLATRSEVDYKGYKTEQQDNTPFREETFNQECFTDGYTVLGNLVLPRPTGEHKELAERWEGKLHKLNKRDMKELRDRPINDLNEAFTRFQDREVSTWKAHQEERSPTHLVKPSGCLESPLALRLNQLSFTSDNIDNGETADPSNGCMAMVMGSGYHADNLLFDHFTDDIANSMTAKVEVLFGAKVQKRLLARQAFEVLPLWGEFEGVVLLLALEESYSNFDYRYKLRRIMLAAYHPQFLFYQGKNTPSSLRQEKTITAAIRMTGDTSIPWEEGYYSNKLWLGHIPFAARSTLECRVIGHQISQGQRIPKPTILKVDDDIELTPEQQYDRGSWDARFFSEKSWSNQELRELIPPALAALETAGLSSANWSLPTDLPDPVLYWLKGQKHILFSKTPISSLEDVANTLRSILPRVLSIDANSTKEILKQTLMHQETQLGEVKLSHQQFWHSRFDGSVVEVFCGTCGHSVPPDKNSRWSVNRPGVYITCQRRCQSNVCKGESRKTKPKEESIKFLYTTGSVSDLATSSEKNMKSPLLAYIREKGVEDTDLPPTVECWCFQCKDKTRLTNGTSRFYDEQPRWTLGTPLYFERVLHCKNCTPHKNDAKRFVPVDDSLRCITSQALMRFHHRYGLLGRQAHEMLMTAQLASSKEPRGSRKRSRGEDAK